MSQPGTGNQRPPALHGDKKANEASSKAGEKNTAVAEKKAAAADGHPPKTQTSGTASAAKKQFPPVDAASKPQGTKPSETKPTAAAPKMEPGKNTETPKPKDSQGKQLPEEKGKEPTGKNSQSSPPVTAASDPKSAAAVTTAGSGQPPPAAPTGTAQPKPEKISTAAGAGGAGTDSPSLVAAADELSAETEMDQSALDSLIDTLGGPEEDVPPSPVYTGPEVLEDISSRYLEELGKREGSLPPEYLKLLKSKVPGRGGVPPKAAEQDEKSMTEDELAEALSSGFTFSAAAGGKETALAQKPDVEGEVVQAQAAASVKTAAPPKEKTTKAEEEMKEDAMEALLDTLGGPEPEPEPDLTPVVEVSEAKAKEKKEEKLGEREETIPPDYRLKPELDKDGKPVLPKPKEQPKPLSDSDLVDEFSKDFSCPAQPAAQTKPAKPRGTCKKPSAAVLAKAPGDAAVPRASACTLQSSAPSSVPSVGQLADEALEALSSSLGKKEPDPEEQKPAVDKVKEKSKKEQLKKLGEEEESIPPDYRLTAAKDQDGKPLLPKPEEKSQPMSENDLLEGLSAGFASSPPAPPPAVTKKAKRGAEPAGSSQLLSAAAAAPLHSAAPASGGKEMDEALDLLSDSLGQREPDPDEGKAVVDKVKEKAKSEQIEKLGEREETMPPDYRKLLESGEQGKPGKATAKEGDKHKGKKKAADAMAAIDALAGDFDSCAQAAAPPEHPKDSSGKEATSSKPTPKEKGKPKDPKKARGQPSSSKPEKQKTS